MSIKVSVVVPVYNPGPAIEPCIASLVGQSLPIDQVELIFVDDGSTDGTPARLHEVAATHANVRVIRIPASGAPGRPRNVGLAEAQGEYVHFVDADDVLAPRALEWLTAMADQHGSDVVIGKYASATLDRSQALFTHNRPRCTLTDTSELMTASWAPAKLFRTAVLREHGIVFPEGWRWLEDQLFVLRAYLAARTISVFADEPCYFFIRRDDGGHLSSEDLDPESHVAHLREVFDVIEVETSPGALRDILLRRFYRANVLSRLDRRYLEASPELRGRMFAAFHGFVVDRLDASVDESFAGAQRVRAKLLRGGDAERLLAFTQRIEALELDAVITRLAWRLGRLALDVRGELRSGSGEPLTFVSQDGKTWLDPALTGQVGGLVEAEVDAIWARVSLIEPASAVEWMVPAPFAFLLADDGAHPQGGRRTRPSLVASVEIDPGRVGPAGSPMTPGRWSVVYRWRGLGLARGAPLRPVDDAVGHPLPALLGDPARLMVPRLGADGLSIEVGAESLSLEHWRAGAVRIVRDGRRLEAALPVVSARGTRSSLATIVLRLPEGDREWPAAVAPDLGWLHLRSLERGFGTAGAATADAPLLARFGPPLNVEVTIGHACLDGAGGITVIGAVNATWSQRTRRRMAGFGRSAVGDARAGVRRRAMDVTLRLPPSMRRTLIRAYRAVRNRRA
ncbi:MAG: glycosyltransferase [Candidatus Limnocylindrales bacterium]